MFKKTMLLAMAVVAVVAFAVPAVASATPLLTNSSGGAVQAGDIVTATQDSEAPVITRLQPVSLGQLECEEIDLSLEVTVNTTTTVQGHGEGEATNCNDGPNEVIITAINISNVDLNSNTGGSGTFTFVYDIPALSLSNCEFSGTVGLTYAHNSSTVSIGSPNSLSSTGSPLGCPLSASIEGAFTLEDAGGPVVIH